MIRFKGWNLLFFLWFDTEKILLQCFGSLNIQRILYIGDKSGKQATCFFIGPNMVHASSSGQREKIVFGPEHGPAEFGPCVGHAVGRGGSQ